MGRTRYILCTYGEKAKPYTIYIRRIFRFYVYLVSYKRPYRGRFIRGNIQSRIPRDMSFLLGGSRYTIYNNKEKAERVISLQVAVHSSQQLTEKLSF